MESQNNLVQLPSADARVLAEFNDWIGGIEHYTGEQRTLAWLAWVEQERRHTGRDVHLEPVS